MSERFYLTASPAEIKRQFKLDKVPELVPRYNIAPTQPSPIVVAKEKSRELLSARSMLPPKLWKRSRHTGFPFSRSGVLYSPTGFMHGKHAALESSLTRLR